MNKLKVLLESCSEETRAEVEEMMDLLAKQRLKHQTDKEAKERNQTPQALNPKEYKEEPLSDIDAEIKPKKDALKAKNRGGMNNMNSLVDPEILAAVTDLLYT